MLPPTYTTSTYTKDIADQFREVYQYAKGNGCPAVVAFIEEAVREPLIAESKKPSLIYREVWA